ncbi:hypothetical protein CL651_000470 [bacterium]|nr:hypothetical protein [bacterium]|tara:strand:- start:24512 stop:24745 length:234 start_codon:yes stop_codon:yes gene_type:complete
MKYLRITTSSILSILILLGLMFFFSIGFGIVLLIYLITKVYGLFFKKKKPVNNSNVKDENSLNDKIIDVEEDDYKID